MPRAERPLERDGSPLVEFASDLRKLREGAGGPSYRELGRRAHYSSTTLSDAAGGRRLPSLDVTLAYVRACGGDVEQWERRWHSVAAKSTALMTERAIDDDEHAPYVGLRPYGGDDADRFFRRERLTEDLLRRVAAQRFVAVFGPSGSGKSSLLRAGFVPRLTARALVFTPGAHPLEECALQLAAATGDRPGAVHDELASEPRGLHRLVRRELADGPSGAYIVIVLDQFEELFTVCQDERERSRFITMLLTAATAEGSRCRVVLGVRADFYPHCALNPELAEALQDAQVTVGPMSSDELRRAISQPAIQAQCTVENALLTSLIAYTHDRPGVLPLLSHALLETWRRRRGATLTHAGFQASGGFEGALVKTAEAVFTRFDDRQRDLARDLFQRLTAPGKGTEDTKRRISTAELDDDPVLARIVDQFTQARLLTRGEDSLELAHEALIKAWPRLGTWLAEDREGQRVHRELTDAAAAWRRHDQDPSVLLRGNRLAVIRDWADRTGRPSAKEHAFLKVSITADERERDTKRRMIRRQRQLLALLSVLLLLAVSVTVYATHSQEQADSERNKAIALKVLTDISELSRIDPDLAAQLSLVAYRLAPSAATLDGFIAAAADRVVLTPVIDDPNSAHAADDGRAVLYTSSRENVTQIWQFSNQQWRRHVDLVGGWGASAGSGIAATSDNHPDKAPKVRIWNVEQPQRPEETSVIPEPARLGTLSPDGRLLVTLDIPSDPASPRRADTAKLWDLKDPRQPLQLGPISCEERPDIGKSFVMRAAFLGTGAVLLHCGIDPGISTTAIPAKSMQIWEIGKTGRITKSGQLGPVRTDNSGSSVIVNEKIALTREPRGLTLWDMENLREPREILTTVPLDGRLGSGAIAPKLDLVAIADDEGRLTIRSLRELGSVLHTINLPGRIGVLQSLAFHPHDKALIGTSLGAVSTAWRWNLDPERAAAAVCARPRAPITAAQWDKYFPGISVKPPCE
ncbi:helix-turn-helix domain-containing protein [Amycolatopsis umgeniensis]|uniref:HTH cro/C1-type domain-containing protein n=1 Tax=Amycolatopsis umgeniensis TaxID=336628 RepID=A0A841AV74_9PSEU|nr:helix-turn-helix domain-containing protein [Amycolatopsis umgeniensis]MBB5850275.1 hypothetical protein [Amycolatopsis umgeniensis]